MKNSWMAGVFAVGLAVVGWVAWGFVGISPLALAMTAVIAGVYVLGAVELMQFRAASRSLAGALSALPDSAAGLEAWSQGLHASVRSPVLRRIDGERAALPGPALTPYLVGLLVMLGMLGTFLGMVVTFKGAVVALEASTQLESIRAALAAPIKGLGLSFGTSVAGVAASAMLGLMSALARRERLAAVRLLDSHIAKALRPFSGAQRRDAMLDALQAQAGALPLIAERLEALASGIERRHEQLDAQLLARSDAFHRDAASAYTALAAAVGASLQDNLKAGAVAAGDIVRPVVERAMLALTEQAAQSHARLDAATETHLRTLGAQWEAATREVSATWTGALRTHEQTHGAMLSQLDHALQTVTRSFMQRSDALLATVHEVTVQSAQAQAAADEQRLARWGEALNAMTGSVAVQWEHAGAQAAQQQRDVAQALQAAARQLDTALQTTAHGFDARTAAMLRALQDSTEHARQGQAQADRERLEQWNASMAGMAATLAEQWQRAAVETVQQQQAVGQALADTADRISQRVDQQLEHTLGGAARLLEQSEALVQARTEAEAGWLQAQGQRMDSLAAIWQGELAALRDQEAERGQAAVERLDALQAAVAVHLQNLGAALEAPLTRLLQTASEVPQAAAGVITQLREEMSRLSVRDTQALAERTAMTGQLGQLLEAVGQAADRQGAAIESMVGSAAQVLEQATAQFAAVLDAQTAKADGAAAHVAASAVELSSLGESFAHGVALFTDSNDRLMQGLGRIESALGQSMARSDEQLAYYVAQAREVIDLSMTSQQAIVEDLRRLHAAQARTAAVAEAA
ncbi:MAG: DUF802 domain-containing protein [Acidovorax sp.]|uniref:DUF802 domain-containing protein n=1 Tax=Acidovorax sp. TaxID=1872122 RepID=UPI002624C718|nr:DUF802 domain-containing protein [Acidovorax sp.]MDH4466086.1 DUF802 domain-containing protein [Acidovorax sp.]